AETLVVRQGVLEALVLDLATLADALGLPGGAAFLREERLRIGLRAQGAFLPILRFGLVKDVRENFQLRGRVPWPIHDAPPLPVILVEPHVRLLASTHSQAGGVADTNRRFG